MLNGKRILAVVPARSGSKGIIDKNLQKIAGHSLIAHAGHCLSELSWIDNRVISTDSLSYAEEGKKHGLEAPFIRPEALSSDQASAIDTMQHALLACESHYQVQYDIFLLVEPTSPLRTANDIAEITQLLIQTQADSVVSISAINQKYHPQKLLVKTDEFLVHYQKNGERVVARQQLKGAYYIRNGVCYALTRECLIEKGAIFTDKTREFLIERPLVNIDEPIDLNWAEFLFSQR